MKDWIREEMVSRHEEAADVVQRILDENKEDARQLVRFTEDGKIAVQKLDLPARLQILVYFIGAAYARAAELRDEDAVPNKELVESLKLKEGTVAPYVKELKESGHIIQVERGLHRIDYRRIKDILAEIKGAQ